MKRLNKMLLLALSAMLVMAGCGGKAEAVDILPGDAAAALVEQVDFQDSLQAAAGDVAAQFYNLDDTITDFAIYISGSGATAEEVAVLKVEKEADAAHAEEIIKERLGTLKDMFENYRPDEMVKIGDPVIETRGNVVYFVCTSDTRGAKDAIAALYKA